MSSIVHVVRKTQLWASAPGGGGGHLTASGDAGGAGGGGGGGGGGRRDVGVEAQGALVGAGRGKERGREGWMVGDGHGGRGLAGGTRPLTPPRPLSSITAGSPVRVGRLQAGGHGRHGPGLAAQGDGRGRAVWRELGKRRGGGGRAMGGEAGRGDGGRVHACTPPPPPPPPGLALHTPLHAAHLKADVPHVLGAPPVGAQAVGGRLNGECGFGGVDGERRREVGAGCERLGLVERGGAACAPTPLPPSLQRTTRTNSTSLVEASTASGAAGIAEAGCVC